MRKSTYALRFRVAESVSGLSQFLSGQIGIADLLYSTNYENLDIILQVRPFPIRQLFLGRGFFHSDEKLREHYDYILLIHRLLAQLLMPP